MSGERVPGVLLVRPLEDELRPLQHAARSTVVGGNMARDDPPDTGLTEQPLRKRFDQLGAVAAAAIWRCQDVADLDVPFRVRGVVLMAVADDHVVERDEPPGQLDVAL